MVTYGLAQSILFHILIEEREKLALRANLMHTFQDYMRMSCGAIHVMSYVLS